MSNRSRSDLLYVARDVIIEARKMHRALAEGLIYMTCATDEELCDILIEVLEAEQKLNEKEMPDQMNLTPWLPRISSSAQIPGQHGPQRVMELLFPSYSGSSTELSFLRDQQRKRLSDLAQARAARKTGHREEDPRVKKAQEAINALSYAAQQWANSNRRQVIKDMLAFRGATVQDDGSVRLTRRAVLNRVSRMISVPESTLRDWLKAGYLTGVPAAQKKYRGKR